MLRRPFSWNPAEDNSDQGVEAGPDESESTASEMTSVASKSSDSIGPRIAFLREVYKELVRKSPELAGEPFFASQRSMWVFPHPHSLDEGSEDSDENTDEGAIKRFTFNRWWTQKGDFVWDVNVLDEVLDDTLTAMGLPEKSYWTDVLKEVGPEGSVLSAWTNRPVGMSSLLSGLTDEKREFRGPTNDEKGASGPTDEEREAILFLEWLKRHGKTESIDSLRYHPESSGFESPPWPKKPKVD